MKNQENTKTQKLSVRTIPKPENYDLIPDSQWKKIDTNSLDDLVDLTPSQREVLNLVLFSEDKQQQ